jgi:hypothetical protein
MPKYRRVEVCTKEFHEEGWFRGISVECLSAIVEMDDGRVEVVATDEIKFITSPNVKMDQVCGTCGRVMEDTGKLAEVNIADFRCVNTKCHEYQEVTPEQAHIDDELGGE